jgi:natural product precursor
MKKNAAKLKLNRETLRKLSNAEVSLVAGGRVACGCSWTCTEEAGMCTVTELAGGCHVTTMTV